MAVEQWAKDIDVDLLELRGADAQHCPDKPKDAFNPTDTLAVRMNPRSTSELNGLDPSIVQIGKIPSIISVTSIVEEISHVNSMCKIVNSLEDLLSGFFSQLRLIEMVTFGIFVPASFDWKDLFKRRFKINDCTAEGFDPFQIPAIYRGETHMESTRPIRSNRAQSIQIVKQSPYLAYPFAIWSVEQHWAYDLNRPYAEISLGNTKMEEAKSLHWLLDEVSMVTSSVRFQRSPTSAMPSTSDCIAN